MAEILKNCRLYTGGVDLTGVGNKIEVSGEAEEKDSTTWSSYDPGTDRVWKQVTAGNKMAKLSGAGLWEAGDPSKVDDASFAALGGRSSWTACPRGGAVGDVAYLTYALQGKYGVLGSQGDLAPWSADWTSAYPLARGVLAHPAGTARTATGTGTGVQLPAIATGSELIAALHVLSATGTTPSITVAIQSASDVAFASPTTRVTFGAATDRGGQAARLAGPITDTYYRATWTITGTGPSFLFVVSIGVA